MVWEAKAGDVVVSRAGHDRQQLFVVLGAEGEYVFIADGKSRTLEKPKKKKRMHLNACPTKQDVEMKALVQGEQITNAALRRHLKWVEEVMGLNREDT